MARLMSGRGSSAAPGGEVGAAQLLALRQMKKLRAAALHQLVAEQMGADDQLDQFGIGLGRLSRDERRYDFG